MSIALPAKRNGSLSRSVFTRALATVLAACMAVGLMQGRAEAAGLPPVASVTISKLSIRKTSSSRAHVVTTANKGDVVKVISSKGTWYQVATSAGQTGWCLAASLVGSNNTASFKPSSTALLDWPSEFINISQTFTYQRCVQDMNNIAKAYSSLARIEKIGTTVMGNPIEAIVLGNPNADTRILLQAEIHAREYITAIVALRQAECMLKAATLNAAYGGIKVATLLDEVEIYIVPMANPDGERLVTEGLSAVPASKPALKAALQAMNNGSKDFTRWKANANGVDLNRNFDAGWKVGTVASKPGKENYPGTSPCSEPESIALRDLVISEDFAMTLSYHSSGNMIYWHDPGTDNQLNLAIAGDIKTLNGYRLLPISSQAPSGGFRDWYVKESHRPGMTVELGSGYCPLPMSMFGGIWQSNRFLLLKMLWTVAPKSLSTYTH